MIGAEVLLLEVGERDLSLVKARSMEYLWCMSTKALEEKLAGLTARMEKLEGLVAAKSSQGWKAIIGTAKGDALDREAAALGAAWRAKENKRK